MDVVSFRLADATVVSLLTGSTTIRDLRVCGVMQRADARSCARRSVLRWPGMGA